MINMINLYVKFNVHPNYAKQIIVLKVADRRTDGRTDGRTRLVTTIGIRQNFGWGLKMVSRLQMITTAMWLLVLIYNTTSHLL